MAESPTHPLLVLVSLWEYECCGDPLRAGDTTTLQLIHTAPDRIWSRRLPVAPEWHLTRHRVDEVERVVRAQVFRLWEAFCDLQRNPNGSWDPAPSSGTLRPVLTMQPHRDTWQGDPDWHRPGMPAGRRRPRAAQAWVVLLDVLQELPLDTLPEVGRAG